MKRRRMSEAEPVQLNTAAELDEAVGERYREERVPHGFVFQSDVVQSLEVCFLHSQSCVYLVAEVCPC